MVAAKVFGFFFFKRTPSSVIVRESERGKVDVENEYTILAVLEFNSTRKRQSVIVRESSGRIVLYIKVRHDLKYAFVHLFLGCCRGCVTATAQAFFPLHP